MFRKGRDKQVEEEEGSNYVQMGKSEKVRGGESSPRRKTAETKGGTAASVAPSITDTEFSRKRNIFFSTDDYTETGTLFGEGTVGDETITRNGDDDDETRYGEDVQTILRYRGFSTSIKDLFLDESLVCASIGCFGLFLSNRTEYLLQVRNDGRGVRWGRSNSKNSLPSRIVAFALLLTLFLIAITFCIWGFGGQDASLAQNWYDGYDIYKERNTDDAWRQNYQIDDDQYKYFYGGDDDDDAAGDDDANNDDANNDDAAGDDDDAAAAYDDDGNNNGDDDGNRRVLDGLATPTQSWTAPRHAVNGICKIRDMDESLWQPAIRFLRDEWYREEDTLMLPKEQRAINANNNNRMMLTGSNYDAYGTEERTLASDVRISLFLAFLIVLGILGRRRRMRTRYYLVRARAQEDHLYYASASSEVKQVTFQDSREDQYEGACSHTLCGCYPADPKSDGYEVKEEEIQVDEDGVFGKKKQKDSADIMSKGFSCLSAICCGTICRCWFQCLSICALAQEAREIRLLVPTKYQRLDYITHQPFSEYYKGINDLRKGWLGKMRKKGGIMPHFEALSKLSRYILIFFLASFCIISLTLAFNPRASFSWPDIIILLATFGQSFLVLYLAHWIFHKSDLSLDAVIKFFAAGFLIAVPSAFVFEGILVNIILSIAYFAYFIGQSMGGDNFTYWIINHYGFIWIVFEFMNAFLVAAITEELCKYYTFRTVEHPDLLFLTGLDRSANDNDFRGGKVKYPFGANQIENSNRPGGSTNMEQEPQKSTAAHRNRRDGPKEERFDLFNENEMIEDEEPDVRTYRQKAAAVTTAMISVAVGLACAENFVYVFFLGGTAGQSDGDDAGNVLEEWLVLLFRSIFPVHALAAAMQSINVNRKLIEGRTDESNQRIGVGKIVFPAILMHGTFDAVLLGINIYVETKWESYLEKYGGNVNPDDPPYDTYKLNIVAWCSITAVMLVGLVWYFIENRKQKQRLEVLEETERAKSDEGPSYKSPSEVPAKSEIEIV